MKKIKAFFAALIMLIIFVSVIDAQVTTITSMTQIERNNGLVLRWNSQAVDSAGVLWSQTLDLTHYDNASFATYPIAFSYRPVKITATDSLNFSVEYWTCNNDPTVNANWSVADTLFTAAVLTTTATPAVTRGTHDLNDIKAAYGKFKLRNNGTGSKAHTNNVGIYFYLKD